MLIRFGYDISLRFPAPTEMIMMLHTHPSLWASLRTYEHLISDPPVALEAFIDLYGNHCTRASCGTGVLRLRNDAIIYDSGMPDTVSPQARQFSLHELPTETLHYLIGSRYCELELLSDTAWNLFGQGPAGWARVQAICDWVHAHVTFGYHFARVDRTAYQTYLERRGVCRDYTHLAIAFCRCMGIPARYATGYLGDIHVPPDPNPMDFSAWFEVFLGGQWHTFDARNNRPRVGRILMARGRDAADVALTTTFGKHVLENFTIWTYEISQEQARRGL
jgi:transglutaminase-like putative cysteine protease